MWIMDVNENSETIVTDEKRYGIGMKRIIF